MAKPEVKYALQISLKLTSIKQELLNQKKINKESRAMIIKLTDERDMVSDKLQDAVRKLQ